MNNAEQFKEVFAVVDGDCGNMYCDRVVALFSTTDVKVKYSRYGKERICSRRGVSVRVKKLKVEKDAAKTPCKGCVFVVNECNEFINSFVGPCTSQVRTDKTDVIFVEVK